MGFIRCSDCDIELVDHLPADPVDSEETVGFEKADDSEYVVIATVGNPLEESQICSFLHANGIPAQARGKAFREVYGFGLGFAEILVPRELADTALNLLAKADRGELEIDAADGKT